MVEDQGLVDMFLDEARLTARFSHANVVQVYEVGDIDGSHFMSMEYLEGQSLDRLRNRCLRAKRGIHPAVACRISIEALEGLKYVHELKDFEGNPLHVIHRDISPHNIFLTYDGLVKILDFGIAKAEGRISQTDAGQIRGKYAYIAPEQAQGGEIDHRADLWSIGVVLWEMLTGRKLFSTGNNVTTLSEILESRIPNVTEFEPEISETLAHIVEKSLRRDPEKRYQSAAELSADLDEFLRSQKITVSQSELSRFVRRAFRDIVDQHQDLKKICVNPSESGAPPPESSEVRAAFEISSYRESSPPRKSGERTSRNSQKKRWPTTWLPLKKPRTFLAALFVIIVILIGVILAIQERVLGQVPIADPDESASILSGSPPDASPPTETPRTDTPPGQ